MQSVFNARYFYEMPVLSLGDTGEDVKYLQGLLNYFDYQLVVDGIFGIYTEQAVKDFQQSYSLVVDGVVGFDTWETLHQNFHDFVGNREAMAVI